MGEASKYSFFLEYASITVVILGLLGHTELITAQDYNVAIGLFLLYSAYSQNGRSNAVGALILAFSLIVDIIIMAKFGQAFRVTGPGEFGLAMLIMNFLVKIAIVVLHYFLYNELGDISFPGSSGGSSYETTGFASDHHQQQSAISDVHYQSQTNEPIGSSYQAADTSVPAGGYPAAAGNGDAQKF